MHLEEPIDCNQCLLYKDKVFINLSWTFTLQSSNILILFNLSRQFHNVSP